MPLAVAMLQSPPMTGYKSGAPTRRAILLALLESEPRTVRGLAETCEHDPASMHRFVLRMERDGLLRVDRGRGRRGSSVYLTEAGKLAARTL